MPGRDATRPAEGSDGEPADGAGWSGGAGEGAQPQSRGDLHSAGHQPGWTVAAPRGDLYSRCLCVRTSATQAGTN